MRGLRLSGMVATVLAAQLPAAPLFAQGAPVASGVAKAAVVAPIAVVREADLDFGTVVVSPTSGGTVTVAPLSAGARYTGGVDGLCGTACAPMHPARFLVHGEAGRAYLITLPARLTIAVPGGTTAVLVDSLVAAAASSTESGRGILSARGQDRFEVGGTLHLPAAAPPAQYTTQVPVIVDYL